MYKRVRLTLRIVLHKYRNFFCRFGQFVGCLFSRGLPQVYPVVFQNLISTAQTNLKITKKTKKIGPETITIKILMQFVTLNKLINKSANLTLHICSIKKEYKAYFFIHTVFYHSFIVTINQIYNLLG